MRADVTSRRRTARWHTTYLTVIALLLLSGAFSIAEMVRLPAPAQAANITVDQCNDRGPGPGGATTGMTCSVTVVNTIDGLTRSSTVTVTRLCSLDPCAPGNGTTTTTSNDLVTDVLQCNGSGNDAAHRITCTVDITNNISAGTAGAEPVTSVTVNQCVGSATGDPPGTIVCDPYPATTTGATVTQCNGSGTGGGGTVNCTVGSQSTVSPALPIRVNQCNGSGNPGGSVVTCRTSITTRILAAPSESPTPTGTATPTVTPTVTVTPSVTPTATVTPTVTPTLTATPSVTPTRISRRTPSNTPTPSRSSARGGSSPSASSTTPSTPTTPTTPSTPTGDVGQVSRVPSGGVGAGGGSTAGMTHPGLLMTGLGLLALAAIGALLRRRVVRKS